MPIRTKIIIRVVGLGLLLALILMLLPGCGGKGVLLVEAQVSATQGGSVASRDGKIILEIPPGALTEDTVVSIRVLSEDEWTDDIIDLSPVGPVYQLEPDGLIFQEPVIVKLALDSSLYIIETDRAEITVPLLYSSRSNSQPELLQGMETIVGPEEAYIQGNTTHFSIVYKTRGTVELRMRPGEVNFENCADVYFKADISIKNVSERQAKHPKWGGQGIPTKLTGIILQPMATTPVTRQSSLERLSALVPDSRAQYVFSYYITEGKGSYGAIVTYYQAPVDNPEFKHWSQIAVWGEATARCWEDEESQASIPSPSIEMPALSPPPKVTFAYPANDATSVSVMDGMWIEFDTPMDPKSTEEALSLYPPKAFETSWANGNTLLKLTLHENLAYDTEYALVLGTEAMSALGCHLEELYKVYITTEKEPDTKPPLITSAIPDSEETSIAVDAPIAVTFSEPMDKDSVESAFSIFPSVEGKLVWSDNTMTFYPAVALDYGASYAIVIDTKAKDLAGNSLEQSYSREFTTKEAPE